MPGDKQQEFYDLTEQNFIGGNNRLFDKSAVTFPGFPKSKEQEELELELQKAKESAKSCPFCRGFNLSFKYTTSHGHGDSGYDNARISCNDCSGSKGKGYGYGRPGIREEIEAYVQWNTRT